MTSKKFQDKKKQGNCLKLFSFVSGSCECFRGSRIHNNMTIESSIEKLQWIVKEREV
jgi:hypothetical protein